MTRRPPLFLAYVVFVLAAATLVGIVFHEDDLVVLGGSFGMLAAMAHGIGFFLRVRTRREPAVLGTRDMMVLGITLGAMLAVVISQFVVIGVYVDPIGKESASGFMWMTLLGLVVIRAWLLRSARRAALMQMVAVIVGVPQLVTTVIVSGRHASRVVELSVLVAFAVIGLAGAVLDMLYHHAEDKAPSPLPEATVLRR